MSEERIGKGSSTSLLEDLGVRQVRSSGRTITLTQEDMPWLSDESTRVHLAEATMPDGTVVFIGSAVRGKTLVEETARNDHSNRQFFAGVAKVLGSERGLEVLGGVQTPHTVFSLERKNGHRIGEQRRTTNTYFMALNGQPEPTFIKIASTTKRGEEKVRDTLVR